MSAVLVESGKSVSHDGKLPGTLFLVQFLAVGLGYLLYTFNRTAFPIGLKNISVSLGFSVIEMSTLGTIFLVGQAIIGIPAGFWNNTNGRRGITYRTNMIMLIGTVGTGVMSLVLSYLALNFPLTLTYRILFGIFEGMFNISVYSFAGSALPERRAFVNMCLGFFYAAGAMLGPWVFSQILAAAPADSGWRFGLSVFGTVSIVIGVVIFSAMTILLYRTRSSASMQTVQQESDLPSESVTEVLKDVFSRKSLWKGLAIHALNLFTMWDFIGGMPSIMAQHQHRDVLFIGAVFGLGFGLTSAVSPVFGLLADRFGRRLVVLTLGTADIVALYLLIFHPMGQWVTTLLAFVVGVGVNSVYFMGYTLAQDGVPNYRVPIATGIAGATGYLIAGFAGPIHGWVSTVTSWQTACVVIMIIPQVLAVAAALAFLPGIAKWKQLHREGKAIA
jgi:MFS family permease